LQARPERVKALLDVGEVILASLPSGVQALVRSGEIFQAEYRREQVLQIRRLAEERL